MSKRSLHRTGAVAAAMLMIAVCWLGEPSPVSAQIPGDTKTEKTEQPKSNDPDLESPRATLRTFLQAFASDDTAAQIKCLHLTQVTKANGEWYAVRLKRIIDRMVLVDHDEIPEDPNHEGSVDFRWVAERHGAGLTEKELVDAEKIVIGRQLDDSWQFTAETIDAIDGLWERWGYRPVLEGVIEADQPLPE